MDDFTDTPGNDFRYEFIDMPDYKPVWKQTLENISSCDEFFVKYNVDIRVLLTTPLNLTKEKFIHPVKGDPRYMYIIHHAEAETRKESREILTWNNSYMAAELTALRSIFPPHRTFTPSAMAIAPRLPHSSTTSHVEQRSDNFQCIGKKPVAIVQGAISKKRDIAELKSVFHAGSEKWHVKVLTRSNPIKNLTSEEGVQWKLKLDMIPYNEAFQTASFLIAGMSPQAEPHYFTGHPSSNIAYAIHFGLPIIGHEAIFSEYLALQRIKSKLPVGYWHNGTEESIIATTKSAIDDWYRSCGTNESQ